MKPVVAADLFCGAGGTSTGLMEACRDAGRECALTAINHWSVAVATHQANHPGARHLCENLDAVNPRVLFATGELDLLWASPECMHHSIARGGRPINDQSRATAWHVVRWADLLRPKVVLVENVKEFLTWGGIGSNGRPLKNQRGKTFAAWVAALESLGYRVAWRQLCAADYGDPTTRRRLFVQAVCGRRKIVWPETTHAAVAAADLLGSRLAWSTARDAVIDWSLEPGRSVYNRKPPLSEKTMRRILIGYERFGRQPFVIPQHRGWDGQLVDSVDRPLRTVTGTSRGMMLATPYLRLGLVTPVVTPGKKWELVDFRLRMLQPHELAAAQGFPHGYKFTGNKTEQVRQIGNAVPKNLAKALVGAVLKQL